ncbi:hypothetical protein [Opitutus sp. ER46]|uniref:hypothetical protein n=1 Tax=Opitutus sp. ER46 TaxID=2161864 RepID=UPI0011B22300|nr:hypothetical protein [Opitutus sp. ER46]
MLALSLVIAWKQFKGPNSEATLEQADVGRQVAAGQGFTTLVNHPQTVAVLTLRGRRFDPAVPQPELHHAPLYSTVIAAGLRLLPEARRAELFKAPAQSTDTFGGDAFLLAMNLVLLWLAIWLTYELGRRLFEPRVGWVAALAVLVSLPFWQQALALNGTPLLMVLVLATFLVWHAVDRRAESLATADVAEGAGWGRLLGWIAGLGAGCGLLFLTEYSAGALVLVAAGYLLVRLGERRRWTAMAALALGFAVVSGPWMVRNVALTGHPVALAAQNVALRAGDPTAEPGVARATLSADAPSLSLRKLGNKTLTSLQETVKTKLWAGGAMWFVAFFVAGWLYAFRSPVANRLRWVFTASLGVLLLSQAMLNSGESERLAAVWLSPLIMIFGAGFFFVLLGSNALLGGWPRAIAAVLLVAQALPLVHDVMAPPPRVRFHYPPYFPALLRGMRTELEIRQADRFGLMADIPAGMAWYAGTRVWTQPARLRDFYAVSLEQPIGELVLTPRTLDRPFFSELNATPPPPGALGSVANRFGDWGEIYGGLVTGTLPREFPLKSLHRVTENLCVLLNPALPPVRGK